MLGSIYVFEPNLFYIMETKICKKCGVEKPMTEFHKHGGYVCKTCTHLKNRIRYKNINLNERLKNQPQNKICKQCEIEKDICEFSIVKSNSDGRSNICKKCEKINKEIWESKNIEHVNEYRLKYYDNNRDNMLIKMKDYRENNKEYFNKKNKEYYLKNKKSEIERSTKYYEDNKEKVNIIRKINIKNKIEKYRAMNRERSKFRYRTDLLFKMKITIRNIIYKSLKNKKYTKNSHSYEILGCSYDVFIIHLESQFQDWMTWDNYGLYNGELNYGWDIDHVIPLDCGKTEEELLKLSHFTNLQPLCSKINRDIKKHNINWGK